MLIIPRKPPSTSDCKPLCISIKISVSNHPIPHISVQIHPTRIPYCIPREESSLSRVVVTVGEEEETGLIVRIVPPLRVVPEGVVRIGNQGIPPGVVSGGGEDVLVRVQSLNHASLRVEGVVYARGSGSAGEQPVHAPHVERRHGSRRVQFQPNN